MYQALRDVSVSSYLLLSSGCSHYVQLFLSYEGRKLNINGVPDIYDCKIILHLDTQSTD